MTTLLASPRLLNAIAPEAPEFTQDDIDPAEVAWQDHQQSIDMGDEAIHADACTAEMDILARYPNAASILIDRQQKRARRGNVGEFAIEWVVYVKLSEHVSECACEPSLDAAVTRCLKKLDAVRASFVA